MDMFQDEVDLLNSSRESFLKDPKAIDLDKKVHPVIDRILANPKTQNGGERISSRAYVQKPGTLKWFKGRDIPARDTRPFTKALSWPWRKAIYEIDIPRDTFIVNSNEAQILDVAKDTYMLGTTGIREGLADNLFNSTGALNTPHGVRAIFAAGAIPNDQPGQGAYGELDPHEALEPENLVWRPEVFDAAGNPFAISMARNLMNRLMMKFAKIEMISVSIKNFEVFQEHQDSKSTYELTQRKDKVELGTSDKVYFMGAWVRPDAFVEDDEIWLHDFSQFYFARSGDKTSGLTIGEWRYQKDSQRKDEFVADMMLAGNFICRNRHQQGLIYNIA